MPFNKKVAVPQINLCFFLNFTGRDNPNKWRHTTVFTLILFTALHTDEDRAVARLADSFLIWSNRTTWPELRVSGQAERSGCNQTLQRFFY